MTDPDPDPASRDPWAKLSWLASDRDRARAVRDSVVTLSRRLRAQRQTHGVSPTGIAVLARLYRDGTATGKAVADAEDTQPQTLTRVFAQLEEQGLIAKRNDPADGRQVLLSITGAGIRLLQRHTSTQVDWLVGAMDAELTPAEEEILRVAAVLMDRLADHRPG
jgi:DNA-binding MarR family transcriptional regulator